MYYCNFKTFANENASFSPMEVDFSSNLRKWVKIRFFPVQITLFINIFFHLIHVLLMHVDCNETWYQCWIQCHCPMSIEPIMGPTNSTMVIDAISFMARENSFTHFHMKRGKKVNMCCLTIAKIGASVFISMRAI